MHFILFYWLITSDSLMGEMLKYQFVSLFLSKGNNFLDARAKGKISTGPMEPMSPYYTL